MADGVVEALILDLLEWLSNGERSYEEVMDAWRTSCPKLPVWEDANDRGLVTQQEVNGRGVVRLTSSGLALLEQHRPSARGDHAMTTTSESRTTIRGLGEVALRVNDLDAMQKFYEDVIRLPLMTRVPNCAFFRIADGYGGHTQVLALFDRSNSPNYRGTSAATSTIDHIAFEIPLSDFENELKRLRALGLQVETAEHSWVHWRSLYVSDPEGNQVELVCYDSSV